MTQPSPSSREGHEMLRGRPFQSPTGGAGGSQGLRSPAKARVSALGGPHLRARGGISDSTIL